MLINILIVAAALLAALTVHEAAHALALRGLGIPVSHAGIGLPIPPMLRLRIRGVPFMLTLSPWLVGAYVQPDKAYEARIAALPYRDSAWFLNAGVVANLVFGSAVAAAATAVGGHWMAAAGWAAAAVVVWEGRRVVAGVLLPLAALPVLVFVIVALVNSWSHGETGAGFAGMPSLVPDGGVGPKLGFFALMSLIIGLLNMLPLFGLDNGKVVDLVLTRRVGRAGQAAYRATGMVAVAAMMLLAIGSDVWAAVKAVWV